MRYKVFISNENFKTSSKIFMSELIISNVTFAVPTKYVLLLGYSLT
jgi:hypothetical protein